VPVRHKTFGSPNLTLSRDYHFLDLFGLALAEDADTVVLGEGPAEDRFFVQAEYLLWWVKRGNIPALASTGGTFGFLDEPGAFPILGPGPFGESARNGFLVRAGAWLDGWLGGRGIDGSFFFLGRRTTTFDAASAGNPLITRPIFVPNIDPRTGRVAGEDGEQVAFSGVATGALRVEGDSFLWGADANLRFCVCRTCAARSEWFVGYRHLNLEEDLTVTEALVTGPLQGRDPAGTRIVVQDRFRTHNRFHGGQIGWAVGRRWGRFDADARVSVALGVTAQALDIAGSQQRARPGGPVESFTGGLLAVGPNLGSFSNDEFSVVPEATFNVGFMVTPTARVYVGYNFLYWTNVIRPGDQIDRVVDITFVPNSPPAAPSGLARPRPTFQQSDLWAQGLQFGLELRW
jgi:hypothetical protein